MGDLHWVPGYGVTPMTGPGGVVLAINFSTDAAPERSVSKQDRLWGTLLAELGGGEIGRNEDTVFAEFNDAKSAVCCALVLQERLSEDHVYCRVSVNHRPFGSATTPPKHDEIDDSYKLLAVAELKGISISRTIYDEVRRSLEVAYDMSRPMEQCGYLCQNIRGNLSTLDLLQASAVRIPHAAISSAIGKL